MRSMVQGTQELQFGDYQSCCWELIAYVHKNRTSHIFVKIHRRAHAGGASRRSFLWFCHHVIRVGWENGGQLPVLGNGGALVPARFGGRRDSSHLLVSVASECARKSQLHCSHRGVAPARLRSFHIFYPFARISTATHRIFTWLSAFICTG